jgi:hypothetical protein
MRPRLNFRGVLPYFATLFFEALFIKSDFKTFGALKFATSVDNILRNECLCMLARRIAKPFI